MFLLFSKLSGNESSSKSSNLNLDLELESLQKIFQCLGINISHIDIEKVIFNIGQFIHPVWGEGIDKGYHYFSQLQASLPEYMKILSNFQVIILVVWGKIFSTLSRIYFK